MVVVHHHMGVVVIDLGRMGKMGCGGGDGMEGDVVELLGDGRLGLGRHRQRLWRRRRHHDVLQRRRGRQQLGV